MRVVTRLRSGLRQGTGFVIVTADARNANNAVILTAYHVVRGATRITIVEANSGEELDANLRARDLDRDIAFLEVRGMRNGGPALSVTGVVPPVGQELRTTGYSYASDQTGRPLAEISGVLLGAYSRTIPNPRPNTTRPTAVAVWLGCGTSAASSTSAVVISPRPITG